MASRVSIRINFSRKMQHSGISIVQFRILIRSITYFKLQIFVIFFEDRPTVDVHSIFSLKYIFLYVELNLNSVNYIFSYRIYR